MCFMLMTATRSTSSQHPIPSGPGCPVAVFFLRSKLISFDICTCCEVKSRERVLLHGTDWLGRTTIGAAPQTVLAQTEVKLPDILAPIVTCTTFQTDPDHLQEGF